MPKLTFTIPGRKDAEKLKKLPIRAIDLGFSSSKRSCGMAGSDMIPRNLHFGEVVQSLQDWIGAQNGGQGVLILDAPLSHHFSTHVHRNGTEASRHAMRWFELSANYLDSEAMLTNPRFAPWYSGPGAGVSLAALVLLRSLREITPAQDVTIHLFEGFHPRWLNKHTDHNLREAWNDSEVARRLIEGFLKSQIIEPRVNAPIFPHDPSLAVTAGLHLAPDHRSRAPMVIFASETLYNTLRTDH